jgi:hypothetical protein
LTASKTGNLDMQDNIPKEKAEPASNETVWAFDPGNVPRPSDGRRWRTRQADGVTDAEFNQAAEQACVNGTWAKFRANYVGVVAGMTRTSVGTVRRAVRARKAGAMIPAALPPGTSQRDVPTTNGRAQAPDRTPSDRADLVVFRDDQRKKPYAVIECKADGVTDAEFNQNPAVRMAAKRHRRHKTKGLGRVDRCGLVHLSGERKSPIRVSISAPFVLFYGKSVAVFRVNTSVGTVRRAVRARKAGAIIPAALPPGTSQRDVPTTDGRAQALEREANIIADLPRIYGKERRKAQGQTLNAKMNFVRTVSAFSLQPSAFPSPVQPVSKEALITRSRK